LVGYDLSANLVDCRRIGEIGAIPPRFTALRDDLACHLHDLLRAREQGHPSTGMR
jgi:hypothetical protein